MLEYILILIIEFKQTKSLMKNNYKRSFYEPNRPQINDYNNFDLRSLECSTVQQASPSNESYEMSWIEKLVTNIDKNDTKETVFNKKEPKQPEYYQSRAGDYKRRSSLPYTNIHSSMQPQNKKQFYKYDNYDQKYANYQQKKSVADIDVNESFGNFGKIKRRNNTKESTTNYRQADSEHKKSSTYLRKYPEYQSRRSAETGSQPNSIITFNNPNDRSNGSSEMYKSRPVSKEREYGTLYHNYTRPNDQKIFKSVSNTNISDYNRYADKIESRYKEQISKSPSMGSSLANYESRYAKYSQNMGQSNQKRRSFSTSQNDNRYQPKSKEEEEVKMEDMAKRLNKVLQNINQKSKKLSITHPTPENVSNALKNQKNRQSIHKYPEVHSHQRNNHSPYEKDNKIEDQCRAIKKKESDNLVREFKTYDSEYHRSQKYQPESKYSYERYLNEEKKHMRCDTKKINEQNNKYQHMKKSLGASKHVPKDIILEESSSEVASEISPRADFLNKEFKNIFHLLDTAKTGQLTKNNCAVDKIHQELKYLFGGVLSKIRYKNEKYNLKQFSAECEQISKDFVLGELKQIFSKTKSKSITGALSSLNLNQQQIESLRMTGDKNDIQNGSESKRSSNFSEVVKKYQFVPDQDMERDMDRKEFYRDLGNKKNNYSSSSSANKVHWAAPEERQVENLDVALNRKEFGFKKYDSDMLSTLKLGQNKTGGLNNEKQNFKIRSETLSTKEEPRRDFQKLCQNLNNKLNKYLTSINSSTNKLVSLPHTSTSYSPKISLEFNELHKHWNLNRH